VIKFRPSAKFNKNASILFIFDEEWKSKKITSVKTKTITDALGALQKTKQFAAEKNEIFPLLVNRQLILLVGLGKRKEHSLKDLRIAVRTALSCAYLKKIKDVEIIPPMLRNDVINALIEGILIGTYVWKKYITPPKDTKEFSDKEITIAAAPKKIFDETVTICQSVNLTRDLINDNADVVTSDLLEKEVKKVIRGSKNTSLSVLGKKELKANGLNLHLAVNQGSKKEPKLIIVKYNGAAQKGNYTAIIGKGITFDCGGLNLKPSGHMETMKCDMSGAAAVIGILRNAIQLKIKKNILFVLGIAENAIGSRSYKPGDVFKSYSGKTVEIGNTDAEGRLVLADAIAYLAKNYNPSKIIDIATLTGACVVALGYDYTGLVTPDDNFARKLVRASNETDDKVWRLPSDPELKEAMKSDIADIKSTSNQRGVGGTITAAEFLRQFTNDITWAHLDIAGTAYMEGKGRSYYSYGATGAGVRLLTEYLKNN